jgi:hypothetical protein
MREILRILGWAAPVAAIAAAVGIWIAQPVSDQELLANFAKAGDFFRGWQSVGFWPWWTPMFQQGTSLAPSWSVMFSNLLLLGGSAVFGFLAGPKVAVGVCLLVGAAGMVFFLKRWTGNRLAAWLGGVLFIFHPSVSTRAAEFEHFVVVASMAALPWVLWALAGFFKNGTRRDAVVLGASFSALALTYGKTALMAAPLLGAFAVVLYFSLPNGSRPTWRRILLVLGVVVVLAVVPNLPALRESGFVTMFQTGPFEGWQRAFSVKSALAWFDRGGVLGMGMDPGYAPTTAAGGTYLGLVAGIILAAALLRGMISSTPTGREARTLLALALGSFWLSFGPRSAMGGHFEFLRMSAGALDFTPALGWFLLAAQVWVIFRLLPSRSMPWLWAGAALTLVYLFIPGFRILELVPIYTNIRAPFDFYQVTGAILVAGAVALAAASLLEGITSRPLRIWLAGLVAFLGAVDTGVQTKAFFTPRMEREVWDDFTAAQEFLKTAPAPGRVHPFSGRYFYLMTPWMSGRALTSEAFNSYLQQRNAAVLQGSASLVEEFLESYFRISGTAYLLVDKTDPDTPSDLQERLRAICAPVFENKNFAVLAVADPLGSAFLARDFVLAPDDSPVNAMAALGGATHDLAMIEGIGLPTDEPGLQGRVVEGRIVAKEGGVLEDGRAFSAVVQRGPSNYERFEFEASGEAGWVVFNEAWHPDWRAYSKGEEIPVSKAMMAFSAVRTDGKTSVVFEFRAPWWYDWCAWTGVAGWVAVLSWLATGIRRGGGR